MNKVIITGITGQDGLFLTSKILKIFPNAEIIGISRQESTNLFFKNLNSLSSVSKKNVRILNIDLLNPKETENFINQFKPDTIFNLSGPSSVYESINKPKKVSGKIISIFENLTTPLIKKMNFINFFQASSSEMFSPDAGQYLNEDSILFPNSPYADEKMHNHLKVLEYSEKYNWKIISGIMFNHESEFRKLPYLIPKILQSAYDISRGTSSSFEIGSLNYIRDWSFAGDVVDAIILLTKNNASGPYVIGSGIGNSIEELVEVIFKKFDLDYENFVKINSELLRPGDPLVKISDPTKIRTNYSWKPTHDINKIIDRCIINFLK